MTKFGYFSTRLLHEIRGKNICLVISKYYTKISHTSYHKSYTIMMMLRKINLFNLCNECNNDSNIGENASTYLNPKRKFSHFPAVLPSIEPGLPLCLDGIPSTPSPFPRFYIESAPFFPFVLFAHSSHWTSHLERPTPFS